MRIHINAQQRHTNRHTQSYSSSILSLCCLQGNDVECSVLNCCNINTLGNTYHWTQLAKWMEYCQKFSFITSFSKGLIGYSLRYSGEREAAVCMSGIVGWVEGVQGRSAGEELRTRQTGRIHQRGRRRGLHLLQDPKGLTGDRVQGQNVRLHPLCIRIWKEWLSFKNEENLNSKAVSNEAPFIWPCASEIPPMELVRDHSVLAFKMHWHAATICIL